MEDKFLDTIQKAVQGMRSDRFSKSDQLSLGEIVLMLDAIDGKNARVCLLIDDTIKTPVNLDSWRGSYNELAIDYDDSVKGMSFKKFHKMMNDAIGETFTGYKGGEYTMNRQTPVWAAHYGESGKDGVCKITKEGNKVIIKTTKCEF
jgi:hypothetical protein